MAILPDIIAAVPKTKNTAADYNHNFNEMKRYVTESVTEMTQYVDGFMPSVTSQSGKYLTNNGSEASWGNPVVAGTIFYFAGSSCPTGWLVCDGSTLLRADYAALFSAIGDTYGTTDSTNFKLPDLIDKFPQGNTTVGTEKEAGLPDHTHYLTRKYGDAEPASAERGYFSAESSSATRLPMASKYNEIYGNSDTVQPPALTLLPIIKY